MKKRPQAEITKEETRRLILNLLKPLSGLTFNNSRINQ
jgi:hypothetical protein